MKLVMKYVLITKLYIIMIFYVFFKLLERNFNIVKQGKCEIMTDRPTDHREELLPTRVLKFKGQNIERWDPDDVKS